MLHHAIQSTNINELNQTSTRNILADALFDFPIQDRFRYALKSVNLSINQLPRFDSLGIVQSNEQKSLESMGKIIVAVFGRGPRTNTQILLKDIEIDAINDEFLSHVAFFAKLKNIKINLHDQSIDLTSNHSPNLIIWVPEIHQQQKIVEVLSQVHSVIRSRSVIDKNFQFIIPNLLTEMFGTVNQNFHRFKKSKLRDLITISEGTKIQECKLQDSSGYPVYGNGKITGFYSKKLVNEPTIIIGKYGKLWKTIQCTKSAAWIDETQFYISEYSNKLNLIYLMESLRASSLIQKIGSIQPPIIKADDLNNVKILIPDLDSQEKFARRASKISNLQELQRKSKDQIIDLILLIYETLLTTPFKSNKN